MAKKVQETLFQLSDELVQLISLAGSDDPEEQQVFADTLEAQKGVIGLKADQYKMAIDQITANAEYLKKAGQYLIDKAGREQRSVDRMKEAVKEVVELVPPDEKGRQVIQGDLYRFSIAKNGGAQPIAIDEAAVPDAYTKITVERVIDKDKIRRELEEGKELPFAELRPRGTHLSIR